jgi:itaconate CoA-transferase
VVLERPEIATDERFATVARRVENRDALTTVIHEVFSNLTAAEVLSRLDRAQIANAFMNDLAEVWEHPQLKALQRWREIASPAGPLPALLPPGSSDAFEPRMGPVPALGEHTEAILAELGYSEADITRLRAEGAI